MKYNFPEGLLSHWTVSVSAVPIQLRLLTDNVNRFINARTFSWTDQVVFRKLILFLCISLPFVRQITTSATIGINVVLRWELILIFLIGFTQSCTLYSLKSYFLALMLFFIYFSNLVLQIYDGIAKCSTHYFVCTSPCRVYSSIHPIIFWQLSQVVFIYNQPPSRLLLPHYISYFFLILMPSMGFEHLQDSGAAIWKIRKEMRCSGLDVTNQVDSKIGFSLKVYGYHFFYSVWT